MSSTTTQNRQAVTKPYDFCSVTPDGDKLFSVRGGIPLSDAFDKLSALLSSSIAAIDNLASEVDTDDIPGALWQSSHLLNFSYALLQSMHNGHNESRREK